MRGACDDGGSFLIGRTRERHVPVTTAKTGDPISGLPPLCIQLREAFGQGKPPFKGPSTNGIGPFRRKCAKGLGSTVTIGKIAVHVEVTTPNAPTELSPGAPFKGDLKRVPGRSEALTTIVKLEDSSYGPAVKFVEPRQTNGIYPSKARPLYGLALRLRPEPPK